LNRRWSEEKVERGGKDGERRGWVERGEDEEKRGMEEDGGMKRRGG